MTIIVTDAGFAPEDWNAPFVPLADVASHSGAVDLANTDDPQALVPWFDQIKLVRIAFPAYSDGRGFTIGRRLRMLGYTGRLRAGGRLVADQYAMARRTGFDEVEVAPDIAERQPADQWLFRANWREHDYQSKLRA